MSKMTEARTEGRARLRAVLPAARAIADRKRAASWVSDLSDVARAMYSHVTEANLDAVIIKPGEYGGWICDILLKDVPAGIPNAVGTPVKRPWPTRQEAEDNAAELIASFLLPGEHVRVARPEPHRVFEYFGFSIPLPEKLLTWMEEETTRNPHLRYGSVLLANERLDQVTEELFSATKPSADLLNSMERGHLSMLMATLCMAALEGCFRYPDWRAEPVGKHPPREVRGA